VAGPGPRRRRALAGRKLIDAPADPRHRVVIVGAGIAGCEAAVQLRGAGYDGTITLLSGEPSPPYDRTELSKSFLRFDQPASEIVYHRPQWWSDHDIDLRCDTIVAGVSRSHRFVQTDDGTRIGYDRLLLSTGSDAERLLFSGADLDRVHVLHNLVDAVRLREQLRDAQHLVVIGGGWIGAEVAAVARERGVEVTMIVRDVNPLARMLGDEVAALIGQLHRDQGVRVLTNRQIDTIEGVDRELMVLLADGTSVDGDLVVLGVGVTPAIHLAERAALPTVAGGVQADAALRTLDPSIFVAGDIAAAMHPLYGIPVRADRAGPARDHRRVVAAAMLGRPAAYSAIPRFTSVQYGVTIESWGLHRRTDRVTVRSQGALDGMLAFWQDERSRVVGGMAVNHFGAPASISQLIESRRPVSTDHLKDPAYPLADL
jgi:3-phenylpropionate/trans-cinnamate dioxygenase ferredoxin reductase component